MKQISESEVSQAVTILQNVFSFLNTSVAGRFGELQAFLGTNVLGALIPAGTVEPDEEGLQLIQLRKTDVQNLISTLNSLVDVSSGSSSDVCSELINAINNLSNQSSTIRNIIRNELQLNNTNIITPVNTNINSSRETLILQIYQGFSTVITGINDITGNLAIITDTLTSINSRTIQTYDKIIEVLTRIHETRQELKQTADRVIQIWNCIHTPESTVENPVCRPTGTGEGGEINFTDILDDLTAILTCCSTLDTYLRDFDIRVTADFAATRNYINTKSTDIVTGINETKTLVTLANTRILNTQVTLNQINTKIDDISTSGGGNVLPDGIGDVIYNTYNEVNNIRNTVNNTYTTVNQNRTSITNVNNTLNNVYYNTENTFNTINNLYNIANNTYNQLSSIYNTVNNLYQTINTSVINNTYNNGQDDDNVPPQCTVNIMGVDYPCSGNGCDLTPVLNAIKSLRDELVKNVNKEININDCDGVSTESYIVSGYSFAGVFNYFDGVVKKLDNIQTIVCEQKPQKCVPLLIEPSELPVGFTKETQMYITWESESGSRWHSTLWNINPDVLNKLKTNSFTDDDWVTYFGITINRGHKATKQFAYLDVKYIGDKYKKIVFYLSSISECSRLFNWINTKWVLEGIDYKSSSIGNIQTFPTYAQSYIYSVAIQEYINGEKTDELYCRVNPNI